MSPFSLRKGEIWMVLSDSKERSIVVWFRQADGDRHAWDDETSLFEFFEIVKMRKPNKAFHRDARGPELGRSASL